MALNTEARNRPEVLACPDTGLLRQYCRRAGRTDAKCLLHGAVMHEMSRSGEQFRSREKLGGCATSCLDEAKQLEVLYVACCLTFFSTVRGLNLARIGDGGYLVLPIYRTIDRHFGPLINRNIADPSVNLTGFPGYVRPYVNKIRGSLRQPLSPIRAR
jgi:hypothetical protein